MSAAGPGPVRRAQALPIFLPLIHRARQRMSLTIRAYNACLTLAIHQRMLHRHPQLALAQRGERDARAAVDAATRDVHGREGALQAELQRWVGGARVRSGSG